jgi:hypothetical protein
MCLRAAFCTASAEQILPRDSVQRNCFKLALYTTRDHDCISNRIGSGIRTCPRCGCRLATFGALPTPSTISRDHHAEQSASGPSSSSGKTLSSFHLLLARPCRSALPRERFRSMAHREIFLQRKTRSLSGHGGHRAGLTLLPTSTGYERSVSRLLPMLRDARVARSSA